MSTATLTRESVLAMEAGAEMDAMVAIHVMKWPHCENLDCDGECGLDIFRDGEGGWNVTKPGVSGWDWRPSSDIADAREVVEKMGTSSELKERFAIEAVKMVEPREVPITTMTHDCFGGNNLQWRPRTHQVFSLCHLRPVDLCRAALLATIGAEA